MVGNLPAYGTVWLYENEIANILSLFNVAAKVHIQYNNNVENAFLVWKEDGTVRKFTAGPRELYYSDTKEIKETLLNNTDHLNPDNVPTVEENLKRYTQRQIKQAYVARYFQNSAGLSTSALLKMIDSGALKNSPIAREDVKTAQNIWGTSIAYLKGKTTRR